MHLKITYQLLKENCEISLQENQWKMNGIHFIIRWSHLKNKILLWTPERVWCRVYYNATLTPTDENEELHTVKLKVDQG